MALQKFLSKGQYDPNHMLRLVPDNLYDDVASFMTLARVGRFEEERAQSSGHTVHDEILQTIRFLQELERRHRQVVLQGTRSGYAVYAI